MNTLDSTCMCTEIEQFFVILIIPNKDVSIPITSCYFIPKRSNTSNLFSMFAQNFMLFIKCSGTMHENVAFFIADPNIITAGSDCAFCIRNFDLLLNRECFSIDLNNIALATQAKNVGFICSDCKRFKRQSSFLYFLITFESNHVLINVLSKNSP